VNRGLKYGNPKMMLYDTIHGDPAQDDLLYVRNCSLIHNSCGGLDEMFSFYLDQAYTLLHMAEDQLVLNHPIYLGMLKMQQGYFSNQLAYSIELFKKHIKDFLFGKQRLQEFLFGLSFPATFVVALVLYRMIKRLRFHIDSTQHILSTIPVEHLSKSEALRKYLKKGIIPKTKKRNKKQEKRYNSVQENLESEVMGVDYNIEDNSVPKVIVTPADEPPEHNESSIVEFENVQTAYSPPEASSSTKATKPKSIVHSIHQPSGSEVNIHKLIQTKHHNRSFSSPILKSVGFNRVIEVPVNSKAVDKSLVRHSERSLSLSSTWLSEWSSSEDEKK
jgi:hypothetical protein